MIVFASVEALEAGWRTIAQDERATAETLLKRASAELTTLLKHKGVEIDAADEIQITNLETVTCNMVRRVMGNAGFDGVTTMSQGIGATNGSITYDNPDKSLYLSRSDKEMLGLLGSGEIFSIRAKIEGGC